METNGVMAKAAKPRKKKVAGDAAQSPYRWATKALDHDDQFEQKRDALLRTAARAFNETSFHTTSLNELAKRLNIAKPTLYYYVKDKEDILFGCQQLTLELLRDVLKEARDGEGTGMQKLSHFLDRYAELMATDFGACLIRTGIKPLKSKSREKLAAFARQLDRTLRDIIAAGVADRSIVPCDPSLTAKAIFGGFNGIAYWYHEDGEWSVADVSSSFQELFRRSLAASQ